jgi:hypothetical protein
MRAVEADAKCHWEQIMRHIALIIASLCVIIMSASVKADECLARQNDKVNLEGGATYENGKLRFRIDAWHQFQRLTEPPIEMTFSARSNAPGLNGLWRFGFQYSGLTKSDRRLCPGVEITVSCRYGKDSPPWSCTFSQF